MIEKGQIYNYGGFLYLIEKTNVNNDREYKDMIDAEEPYVEDEEEGMHLVSVYGEYNNIGRKMYGPNHRLTGFYMQLLPDHLRGFELVGKLGVTHKLVDGKNQIKNLLTNEK
jgi:hypothetical protein